jgi:hypothetical protein
MSRGIPESNPIRYCKKCKTRRETYAIEYKDAGILRRYKCPKCNKTLNTIEILADTLPSKKLRQYDVKLREGENIVLTKRQESDIVKLVASLRGYAAELAQVVFRKEGK